MKKTGEPIQDFKTIENLLECAKEWQHRLFLDDWYIEYGLVSKDRMTLEDTAGESTALWECSAGSISILKYDQIPNTITKHPQELALVHELLHFKYMTFENAHPQIEDVYYEKLNHRVLEQMAKSLLMTKYNLEPEWFQEHKTFK